MYTENSNAYLRLWFRLNILAKFVCYLLTENVSRENLVVVQKKPRQNYAKSYLLYK